MSAWLKRFGLHAAAAVGATGIFVAAAAVGATQTREQAAAVPTIAVATPRTPRAPLLTRRPVPGNGGSVEATPTPGADAESVAATPPANSAGGTSIRGNGSGGSGAAAAVSPERSLAGSIQDVLPEGELIVLGVGGRTWRVAPAPGALIRLNGKAAKLDALHLGDTVVILGQAQRERGQGGNRFLAHAITARRK